MKKSWIGLLTLLLVWIAAIGVAKEEQPKEAISPTAVEIPKDRQVIVFDNIPGKKGSVTFNHYKHATEYKLDGGKAITCKMCHHTLAEDKPKTLEEIQACGACHVKPNAEPPKNGAPFLFEYKGNGKVSRKSVLYHKNCLEGCHKQVTEKKIKSCKTCHH